MYVFSVFLLVIIGVKSTHHIKGIDMKKCVFVGNSANYSIDTM